MTDDTSISIQPATTTATAATTTDNLSTTTKSEKSTKPTKPTEAQKLKSNRFAKFFTKTVVSLILLGYLAGVGMVVAWHMYETGCKRLPQGNWLKYNIAMLVFLILSYSRGVRCIVTLCIPILCSSKGRTLLITFAFILVATGPTWNILKNVDVLIRSLSCGQIQLKEALEEMLEVMKQPLVAVKNSILTAINNVKAVVKKVEILLMRIKELVLVVLSGIKIMYDWLNSTVKICNKEFGTPYERCTKTADEAMETCREKLGVFKGLCQATHLFSMLCYPLKVVDLFCVMVVVFDDSVISTIMDKLREFTEEIKNIFEVSVTFEHDFTFTTTASRNLSDVGKDIMKEIHSRFAGFFLIFGWLDVVAGFLCFFVIIKAMYFRLKYLHIPSYNNHYLTKDFVEIDEQRKGTKLDRALPLKKHEKRKYIWITSCRLTRGELFTILRSSTFLIISCIQIFCVCLVDYSFYWILAIIRFYGSQGANIEVPPAITIDVKGNSYAAEIFRGIVAAFAPINQKLNLDMTPCLPRPKLPNFKRYFEIWGICLLAWIFLFLEPYGLRLRHLVMRLYYPAEARQRAAWLYNEILIKRVTFFKLLRRKARARLKNEPRDNPYTFMDWIRTKTSGCFLCRYLLGDRRGSTCILCGFRLKGLWKLEFNSNASFDTLPDENWPGRGTFLEKDKVECSTPGCPAVYCQSCFDESNKMCCICKSPMEYGDDSDISLEIDSSDDPNAVREPRESDKYCKSVP